ncbi:unnamed protein product [Adineta ricciae]|uniref:Uncharacterized protein n=1 Tax=Adineta ricciae TaxID=249248 RepID=A0A814AL10_ADIRI|nr:unnamed protein product [Adineta ricciae]CAF1174298.1 unnamed protein product [Adineta ricciae]
MAVDNEDLTRISFDADWRCYCQRMNSETMVSTAENTGTHHDWLLVNLPHVVDTKKLCKWWYCKQFERTSVDKQLHLVFESNNHHNDSVDINTVIQLNNIEIFSGSLVSSMNPIELPSKLLHNENSLMICCFNSTLSLHVDLIQHNKFICAVGEVNVTTGQQKDNEVLDYTVSVDDTSGRLDLTFKSKKKYKAPVLSLPSTPGCLRRDTPTDEDLLIPRLAIVILIVGTRGDVQPFIALGQALRAKGHRVRLATHETFRSFVRGNGLEFYPLGGDPVDLISFMVKNTGIIPSIDSIMAGDVGRKRRSISEILASTWQACIANDDETNMPFTAEAIIANPPSFGHIHCAEKLQIPLHIMFTMPWTSTAAFPHPLSNIDNSTGSSKIINRYSYDVIDTLTWTGMGDIINNFRKKTLGLSILNTSQAVYALDDERVPHTYCWSPSLVEKPKDWGEHIDVSGFFFLDLGTAYTNPPQDLLDFLHSGEQKPIYIGFGSIAGHDSLRILKVVVDALLQSGYRAVLSGLATETDQLPPNIFKIGNVPHDWLFQHVSAVCHHGGAGTTAAGLRAGKPTIVVPFFGDQFFWGTVIAKSGAGPQPVSGKSITTEQLIQAFHFVHQSTTRVAAEHLRDAILKEDGCAAAVRAFHANLPLTRMHSDLEPTFSACYRSDKYHLQISRPVAQVLVSANVLEEDQLRPHATRKWHFKHDNHQHIIMHGFFEHSQKAISKMFIGTASELKRAASNDNLSRNRALDGAGSVAKGVALGIGHLTLGSLSLYGEITDALHHVPYLYDPYSTNKTRSRPVVTNFKSGARAAGITLWKGWKEGFTGVITQPRAGYKRHGVPGAAAGSLIAVVNMGMKPSISTVSSLTWLSRGVYASVQNVVEKYRKEGRRISSKLFDGTSLSRDIQNDGDQEVSPVARVAANASGLHPKVCQIIIVEFEKIKREYNQRRNSSSAARFLPLSFSNNNKIKRSLSSDVLNITSRQVTN